MIEETRPSEKAPIDLEVRQEQLRIRSAQLREQIAVRSHLFRPVAGGVDRVRNGLSPLAFVPKQQGILLLAGAAVLSVLAARPRMAARVGAKTWAAWQMYRRVRPLVNSAVRNLR